jgi:hypothetical protein
MNGMKGVCPRCGTSYYGWALASPEQQRCSQCGSALEIRRDGASGRPGASVKDVASGEVRPDRKNWQDALITNMQFYLRRN